MRYGYLPKTWKKRWKPLLTPVQWRVRHAGLTLEQSYSWKNDNTQKLFNKRLRRSIEYYGLPLTVNTYKQMVQNPISFMLPEKNFEITMRHIEFSSRELLKEDFEKEKNLSARLIEVLGRFNPRRIEWAEMVTLFSGDFPTSVADSLGEMKFPQTLDHLYGIFYENINKDSTYVPGVSGASGRWASWSALRAIAKIKDKSSLLFLDQVLHTGLDETTNSYVAEAAASIGGIESFNLLKKAYQEGRISWLSFWEGYRSFGLDKLKTAQRFYKENNPRRESSAELNT